MSRNCPPSGIALALALIAASIAGALAAEESKPVFVDRAAELGVDFTHDNGMTGELYFAEHIGGAVALFDFDLDGDLDLYLGQGHLLSQDVQPSGPARRDRLYQNQLESGRLRFADVTKESGFDARGYAMGATVGDIDNDGDPDLYILNLGANELWRNDSRPGAPRFTNITVGSNAADPRWSAGASFFDLNADGLLDLFVGNYVEFRVAIHKQCASSVGFQDYCGPSAYRPQANRVLKNLGGGRFEDWTARVGVADLTRPTLGTVASDFDGDGITDIYVANDETPNALLLNQGGSTLIDDAILAGAAVNSAGQPQASMGVLAEDFNGDGLVDLFMTHLLRETNTLYLNQGDGIWDDATRGSGLGQPSFSYTGFGTVAIDYDLDSELDLYIANGAVKRIEEQLRAGDPLPLRQPNQLFRGLGGGRFTEVEAFEQPAVSEVSRGLAAGDLDNDGDPDLALSNNGGPARLLVNEGSPEPRQWIGLDLRLTNEEGAAGRRALGAWAAVADTNSGKPHRWRRFHTDGSYAAAKDPRILFALDGESPTVVVSWPDGEREAFEPGDVGRYVTLIRGHGVPVPASGAERP